MDMAELILKLFVTVWLVVASVVDLLYRRIPNGLVAPIMAGGLVWQIYRFAMGRSSGLPFAVVAWAVIFAIWKVHIFGGGDAKFLMALFALFPDERLLLLVCVGVVLVATPLILCRIVRRLCTVPTGTEEGTAGDVPGEAGRGPISPPSLTDRVSAWGTPIPWPGAEKLESRGQPFVWGFALPGLVYVWWFF